MILSLYVDASSVVTKIVESDEKVESFGAGTQYGRYMKNRECDLSEWLS